MKFLRSFNEEWNRYFPKINTRKPEYGQLRDHKKDADLIKLLGRLPAWTRKGGERLSFSRKINRFLAFQESRIMLAIQNRQWKRAFLIWAVLLKTSKSYQLSLFHRVYPKWYIEMSKEDLRFLLESVHNKCRRWNLKLGLKRFYVIKSKIPERNGLVWKSNNLEKGEKLRPIGSPDYPSRVISKATNDFVYACFRKDFTMYQHGYREKRGVHTALLALIKYIRKHKKYEIYEFDLRSFFNKVRPSWIYRILLRKGTMVAEIVLKQLLHIRYQYKVLAPEKELRKMGTLKEYGRTYDILEREGLPQGLSLSPLLATLTMELFKPPKGLFLYADDGIFVGNHKTKPEFKKWFEKFELTGARLAEEKSGWVGRSSFKFLGVEIDPKTERIYIEGKWFSFYEKNLEQILKTVKSKYTADKGKRKWNWQIDERSYLSLFCHEEGIYWRIIPILWNSILHRRPWRGLMFFWGHGVKNIIASSSECLNLLAQHQKELNLKNIKKFQKDSFSAGIKFAEFSMQKSYKGSLYHEEIYENKLRAYIKRELPEWKNAMELDPERL